MVKSKSGITSSNINAYSEFRGESAARNINYIAAASERKALSAGSIPLSYHRQAGTE
jgi:hypothetical protein